MGNDDRVAHSKTYINVMELLVTEEVDRQLQKLPERVLKYVKRAEVETYALNRLPALYASSQRGLQHQRDHGARALKSEIFSAVRQALAAVQVDPIRLSTPIQMREDNPEAEAVLQFLRDWLKSPDLTWEMALYKLDQLRHRRKGGSSLPQTSPRLASQDAMPSGPPLPPSSWRPGTYGHRMGWKSRNRRPTTGDSFEDTHLH